MMFRKLPYVRRTPGGFILLSNMCDMVTSVGFICIYSYASEVDASVHPMWYLLPVTCAFDAGATLYRALMYIHLVNMYRNPFKPTLHRPLYHFIVWCCCITVFVVWSKEIGSSECHTQCLVALAWGFLIVPSLLFFIIGFTAYVFVRVLLHWTQTRPGRAASISSLGQQRASRHALAYMILFGSQHLLGLFFYILVRVHREYWLLWLSYVFTCGRPVISFFGWLMINDVVYIEYGCCSFTKSRSRRLSTNNASLSPSSPSNNISLAPCSVTSLSSQEQTAQRIQESMARRSERYQGVEDGFKQELRFELLYDIARGIGGLAHEELRSGSENDIEVGSRFRRSHSVQLGGGSFQEPQTQSGILRESSTHDTVTAMAGLLARTNSFEPGNILRNSSRTSHQPFMQSDSQDVPREANCTDCRQIFSRKLQGEPDLNHYKPDDFHAIRTAFGISEVAYAKSFPSGLSEEDPQWREKLKESVSEGASGSFFYRVMNNADGVCKSRYIVKQITHEEKVTLMKILPHYRQHVVRQEGRTLIQYLGCHSVSLRWKFSARVYFVVMRNFLPVKCWLAFDLKGATANRRALAANLLHRAHAGADPRGGAVYGTLRDWEWMDIAMAADLEEYDKTWLCKTLADDAEFLKNQNLLDYSLLVGIHRLPLDLAPWEHEARLGELKAAGGYVSVDRQKVYFFGIIDVLERYTLRWQIQNAVLSFGYQAACKGERADGISALRPALYADRFFTFMQQEVLRTPDRQYGEEEAIESGVCRRCCRRNTAQPLGGTSGSQRWGHLWQRQRRGLVRERIDVERADFLRRIRELERRLDEN